MRSGVAQTGAVVEAPGLFVQQRLSNGFARPVPAPSAPQDRIIEAMVLVVGERGFSGATVGLLAARARVSRRTFYECFGGLEECLIAVMDQATEHTAMLITQAFERESCWQDGARAALAALLDFCDSEPLLARVWIVEVAAAGSGALKHRERCLTSLRELILALPGIPHDANSSPLAAEGLMASLLGVLQARMLSGSPQSLIELLGPLMGFLTRPYLGPAQVAREMELGDDLARSILAGHESGAHAGARVDRDGSASHPSEVVLPALLAHARAERARACVVFIAAHPGASNRQVAAGIGARHQGQVSTLLSRMARAGLVLKQAGAPGRPNAWWVSPLGEEVAEVLQGLPRMTVNPIA